MWVAGMQEAVDRVKERETYQVLPKVFAPLVSASRKS